MADEVALRVYRWEELYVEPRQHSNDRLLAKSQVRDYIERACAATGTRVPTLRYKASELVPCKANIERWEITIAEWGHSAVTVLHEVAHLATVRNVMAGENGHGPSFVRQALLFYNGFLGIDLAYLLETAARSGVAVAPLGRTPKIVFRTDDSPFGDDVF